MKYAITTFAIALSAFAVSANHSTNSQVIPVPHCYPCNGGKKIAEIPMPNPHSPCMPTRGCGKNLQ
jgi:hypothetical protein